MVSSQRSGHEICSPSAILRGVRNGRICFPNVSSRIRNSFLHRRPCRTCTKNIASGRTQKLISCLNSLYRTRSKQSTHAMRELSDQYAAKNTNRDDDKGQLSIACSFNFTLVVDLDELTHRTCPISANSALLIRQDHPHEIPKL